MDAIHDALETLRVLHESGKCFLVKRNPRKEDPGEWLSIAQAEGRRVQEDGRKTVYIGSYTRPYPGSPGEPSTVRVVYEATVVHQDEEGTTWLFPEITVQSFWTNLSESAEEVIRLYHQPGTSEQFPSELKSDLHIQRLPSGKFGVNGMILQVAMVAFNTLRYVGQRSLELETPYTPLGFRKRLRKMIDDLVRVAVKVVHIHMFVDYESACFFLHSRLEHR